MSDHDKHLGKTLRDLADRNLAALPAPDWTALAKAAPQRAPVPHRPHSRARSIVILAAGLVAAAAACLVLVVGLSAANPRDRLISEETSSFVDELFVRGNREHHMIAEATAASEHSITDPALALADAASSDW